MLHQLSKQLNLAQERQQAIVLVRVLETEGSTYRKVGARMLIDEQGQQFDLISGGCLETHLGHHAIQVIQQGLPKVIEYDFGDPDSPAWLLGVGCRGRIKLLLEKLCLENNYGSLTYYIKAMLAAKQALVASDGVYLFPRYMQKDKVANGSASSTLSKSLKSIGCPTAQSLRHTMRTRLRNANVPVPSVEEIQGWNDSSMAAYYGEQTALENMAAELKKTL